MEAGCKEETISENRPVHLAADVIHFEGGTAKSRIRGIGRQLNLVTGGIGHQGLVPVRVGNQAVEFVGAGF